ncbi:hypothetical protein ABK040_006696 [Willaertia magna]
MSLLTKFLNGARTVGKEITKELKKAYGVQEVVEHHNTVTGKVFKLSPHQEVRNKAIEYRAKYAESYLGMVKFVPGVAHVHQRQLNNDIITNGVPEVLSEEGKDLYARLKPVYFFIKTAPFDILSNYDIIFVEEWEMCNKQFEQKKNKLTAKDLELIEPMLKRTNELWNIGLHAENVCSVLADLNNKYRNTYTYPDEDRQLIADIAQDYVELRDKYWEDREVRDKLQNSIFQRLTLVKQKIVLPELELKFPKLFV